jgi:hypothetical protein
VLRDIWQLLACFLQLSQMTVDDDAKSEEDLLNRMEEDNENLPRDGIK